MISIRFHENIFNSLKVVQKVDKTVIWKYTAKLNYISQLSNGWNLQSKQE